MICFMHEGNGCRFASGLPGAVHPGGEAALQAIRPPAGAARAHPCATQVLAGLAGGEWLTMGELSERLCCAGSNVTAVVGRMEEAGLVARRADAKDRRLRRVRITARGRTLLRAATQVPQCCPELGPLLSAPEWQQLCRLLGKLWSRMQTERC